MIAWTERAPARAHHEQNIIGNAHQVSDTNKYRYLAKNPVLPTRDWGVAFGPSGARGQYDFCERELERKKEWLACELL